MWTGKELKGALRRSLVRKRAWEHFSYRDSGLTPQEASQGLGQLQRVETQLGGTRTVGQGSACPSSLGYPERLGHPSQWVEGLL